QGLALHPLGGERAGGDGRTATVGLELGVLDHAQVVDLDLQAHDVAARRRADHAGTDIGVFRVHLADVARVLVVVNDLFAVCHVGNPHSSGAALWQLINVPPIRPWTDRHPL